MARRVFFSGRHTRAVVAPAAGVLTSHQPGGHHLDALVVVAIPEAVEAQDAQRQVVGLR
jgi:hypothetical protein